MLSSRRRVLAIAGACALSSIGLMPNRARAQPYPNKPVRLVVPFPPGGTADPVGRALAADLSQRLGQQVVVENQAGAGSLIGIANAARAPADGYTLILGSADGFSLLPNMRRSLSFDPVRNFVPLSLVTQTPMVFVVNNKVPVKTLSDLVELARSKPDSIRFGSAGMGTIHQLTAEMLMAETGIKMIHVPYKGGGPAAVDTAGGQIECMATGISGIINYVHDGRLRALAVTGGERHPLLPDVPTTIESGYPKVSGISWFGLLAPAGTPIEVVELLERETLFVASQPAFKQQMVQRGCGGDPMPRDRFAAFLTQTSDTWKRVIVAAKIPALD